MNLGNSVRKLSLLLVGFLVLWGMAIGGLPTLAQATEYAITATAGVGGGISPFGDVAVAAGANQTFDITPDGGYRVLEVLVDSVSQGPITNYEFTNVQADHTIHATFEEIPPGDYTIAATTGPNGSISPSGVVVVAAGTNQSFSIAANIDYQVADVLVDGLSQGAITSYEFTNVQANHTIHASFEEIPAGDYTITATAGPNGSITPSGVTQAVAGADYGFNMNPDPGYQIADVVVDGVSQGVVPYYEFTNVQANHTIDASFDRLPPSGSVTSDAVPSDATPLVGDQIVVEINIDLTNMNPPDEALGSYTGSLTWDPAALVYNSHSGAPPAGFTGTVNTDNASSGNIIFNGVSASGTILNIIVIQVTFDVVGAGVSALNLDYSAIAAASTSQDLLPFLTITDGQVTAYATGFTITATAGAGGGIAPYGDVTLAPGDDQLFSMTPDIGYKVSDVVVDGVSQGPLATYEFTNAQADHTINATFEQVPTAATLAAFGAETGAGSITIAWETASEIDNLGFNILRSTSADGTYSQLNEVLINSQAPGSPVGAAYAWEDGDVEPGVIYYYKLEALDAGGSNTLYGPVQASLTPMRRLLPARPRPLPQAPALEAR